MNRWQAIVKIAQSFVSSGHPGYALFAVIVMTLPFWPIALIVLSRPNEAVQTKEHARVEKAKDLSKSDFQRLNVCPVKF